MRVCPLIRFSLPPSWIRPIPPKGKRDIPFPSKGISPFRQKGYPLSVKRDIPLRAKGISFFMPRGVGFLQTGVGLPPDRRCAISGIRVMQALFPQNNFANREK